jgi:hypothetical protein
MNENNLRICKNGHRYHKTTDCPTCPICEQEKKTKTGFLSQLSAPAVRALRGLGITDEDELSKYTESEILALHGMGPASIPKLRSALSAKGKSFRAEKK